MTPLAVKLWSRPKTPAERQAIGDLLASTQFFDCSALRPFIDVRMAMEDARMATEEMLEHGLPDKRMWLEFGNLAGLISDDPQLLKGVAGAKIRMVLFSENGTEYSSYILPDGRMQIEHAASHYDDKALSDSASPFARACWFAIEAMQTPGMTHRKTIAPTRQQQRASARSGKPCHKWVEIRLGRGSKSGGISDGGSGRTVAWHYRRGHRINHPNPNFPKWRKGCWVGDTDAGIRTHNYVVEVPA